VLNNYRLLERKNPKVSRTPCLPILDERSHAAKEPITLRLCPTNGVLPEQHLCLRNNMNTQLTNN